MERRRNLSDMTETGLPKLVEKNPLIDPRRLRSCRSTPGTRSLSRSESMDLRKKHRASSTVKPASHSLKPVSESRQLNGELHALNYALNRSQSAPHYLRSPHYTTPVPPQYHLRSPQYRVNPKVKFGESRPFPERMNYGIAGYNTSRPRSCSTVISETLTRSFSNVPESPARPRSFSGIPETRRSFSMSATRSRSVSSIPECRSIQTTRPGTRAVIWRSWMRRVRDKMGRIRVRDTCSKLLSRFRG